MLTTENSKSFFSVLPPRQKIFKERAMPDIENYMFENHDQLRQAATECMCNMVVNKEVRLGVSWAQRVRAAARPVMRLGAVALVLKQHAEVVGVAQWWRACLACARP